MDLDLSRLLEDAEWRRLNGEMQSAYELLLPLISQSSDYPEVLLEIGLTLDAMSRESEAIPYYERALESGLSPERRAVALLCLGSSLRNVGQLEEAARLLGEAQHEFPEHMGIRCFHALAQFSAGQPAESVCTLLNGILQLAPASVTPFAQGLRHYSSELR